MANPKVIFKNQFGEESVGTLLYTPGSLQGLSTAMPAKAEVTALAPLGGGATLSDVITQLNALLAALKAVI